MGVLSMRRAANAGPTAALNAERPLRKRQVVLATARASLSSKTLSKALACMARLRSGQLDGCNTPSKSTNTMGLLTGMSPL